MDAIVFLGAPGAGKGTAAARLHADGCLRHVSTGQRCRQAMADQTPLGETIRPYMDRGELIPDDLALNLAKEILQEGSGGEPILLDGFPRTPVQAEAFESVLAETGSRLIHVFLLEVDPETLVDRLGARRGCAACGAIYNLLTRPPNQEGRCDQCGVALSKREDDQWNTSRKRLRNYEEQTVPLIAYYAERGILRRIDAATSPDQVARHIREWIEPARDDR